MEGEEKRMIPLLVKQAVDIKIDFENFTGILQSDYEYAYACGILANRMGVMLKKPIELMELKEMIECNITDYEPKNYQEENLIRLIKLYDCENLQAEEIQELIHMGLTKEV